MMTVGLDERLLAQTCAEMIEKENEGAAAASYFHQRLAEDLCFRRADKSTADKLTFIDQLEENSQGRVRRLKGTVDVCVRGAFAAAFHRVAMTTTADGTTRLFRNIRVFGRESPDDAWKLILWFSAELPPAS